ncbi:MAG TPA: ABC transporter permease [Ignavibacteria bacterium]|nr:ABC transporter permease [Ignavibacteria bacterium]
MFKRIYAITIKEFRQIRRDIRTLLLIFIFPVFLLILFGYALNLDVKNIKIAVNDRDNSPESREFIHMLQGSEYFRVVGYIYDEKEIGRFLDEKIAQCVMVIPKDMGQNTGAGKTVKIQFLVDGVDGNTANVIMNYLNIASIFYSQKISQEYSALTGMRIPIPIDPRPVFWYNPELNTTKFFIPGLLSMILILTAVILTCLSIVREKELGSLEQLKVSPLGSLELIVGKTIPFTVVSFFVAAFTLFISMIAFGVEIKGDYFMLFVSTLIYLIASLSLGILISTIADSQQVAFQLSAFITMLPTFILSGFVFPIESMPVIIQVITNITPAKFYIRILRSIMIKGSGLESYYMDLIYLGIFAFILFTIATIRSRKAKAV